MNLRNSISGFLAGLMPTKTRVIVRGHQQPTSSAHTADADSISAYLRSAEAGDTYLLFGLYRDILASSAHLQGEFAKRKLAVLGEPLTLTSQDPKDALAVARDTAVQEHLRMLPGWGGFLSHCLDSTLYPISLSERLWRISARPGWRYEIGDLVAVPHIHLAWPSGVLSIRETDDLGHFTSTYAEPSPRTHIIHRAHLLSSVPDWWGGPFRALVFWWLFATCDRDWWVRFLDRFGSPFLEGKYQEADDRARYELQDAFSAATKLFGLVVSKDTEIKMHQANSVGGGEAFLTFHKTANAEISKLIIGQTSSAEISNAGIGGGQGNAQAEVRDDIRKYDAHVLAQTIQTQILAPLWRINGWTTPVPNVSLGTVSEKDASLSGALIASLADAGIELTDEGLENLAAKIGLGLRRVATPLPGLALSAMPSMPLLPSVARRAARQQQARRAVDSLVAAASPKLATLMRARSLEISRAIESSDSPEAAAAAVASLAASYDPGLAADLVTAVLSSASVNAVLTLD